MYINAALINLAVHKITTINWYPIGKLADLFVLMNEGTVNAFSWLHIKATVYKLS